jgi:hypothetical protein
MADDKDLGKSYQNTYLVGFGILAIAVVLVVIAFFSGIGSVVSNPISAVSGMSTFAVFYLMAQFIERFIEPFSNSTVLGDKDEDGGPRLKSARFISLWCIASGLGIILCYFTVGLFQVVGISFAVSAAGGHFWDAILSGVVVGAGTKPLHDFINLIDKSGNTTG